MTKTIQHVRTPLGSMTLVETGGVLSELRLAQQEAAGERLLSTPLLRRAAEELKEYFKGKRKEFDIPMGVDGTAFQQAVWEALLQIPYGKTKTYGGIAQQIGKPKAARAVGRANNQNPLPIFVPCHRVIGAGCKLVGYAGGLPMKEYLLELEAKNAH